MKIHPALNRRLSPIRFSQRGYERLKETIEELQTKRVPAVEELRKAREMGDLSENGYYKEARARLTFIDSRLRKFNQQLQRAEVVHSGAESGVIDIGVSVTLLLDGQKVTYEIVGDTESDPVQGKISIISPLGRLLKGRRVGDTVLLSAPVGQKLYKIVELG